MEYHKFMNKKNQLITVEVSYLLKLKLWLSRVFQNKKYNNVENYVISKAYFQESNTEKLQPKKIWRQDLNVWETKLNFYLIKYYKRQVWKNGSIITNYSFFK